VIEQVDSGGHHVALRAGNGTGNGSPAEVRLMSADADVVRAGLSIDCLRGSRILRAAMAGRTIQFVRQTIDQRVAVARQTTEE
jgi:hypothetical protein